MNELINSNSTFKGSTKRTVDLPRTRKGNY